MATGTTWRTFVFNVEKILKQNYADAEVNTNSILFWGTLAASRFRYARFRNNIKETNTVEGRYLAVFDGIPIQTLSTSSNPNKVKNRKFIEFPNNIVDLQFDAGVHLLTYSDLDPNCCYSSEMLPVRFSKTTPAEQSILYALPATKPTEANPYYYRSGPLYYLLGLEESLIQSMQIWVYLNATFEEVTDPDTEIGLPEDLIDQMMREVIDLGRLALMIPSDRFNDGDSSTNAQAPKLSTQPAVQQQQAQSEG